MLQGETFTLQLETSDLISEGMQSITALSRVGKLRASLPWY